MWFAMGRPAGQTPALHFFPQGFSGFLGCPRGGCAWVGFQKKKKKRGRCIRGREKCPPRAHKVNLCPRHRLTAVLVPHRARLPHRATLFPAGFKSVDPRSPLDVAGQIICESLRGWWWSTTAAHFSTQNPKKAKTQLNRKWECTEITEIIKPARIA